MHKNFKKCMETLKLSKKTPYFYQPNFSLVCCMISIYRNSYSVLLNSINETKKIEFESLVWAS